MAGKSPIPISPNPRNQFWDLFQTADGVIAVDSQQRIMHWSTGAQEILGYRVQDAVGQLCYEVVDGRDSPNHRFCRKNCPTFVNARRGYTTPDYDILCTTPVGGGRWLNVTAVIPKDSRSNVQLLHLVRDVSRRRTEYLARGVSTALRPTTDERMNDIFENDPRPTPLPRLSPRELEVLRLLATGLGTTQIADTLHVRIVTARNHISRVLAKLGVENRLQAVIYASKHHLL